MNRGNITVGNFSGPGNGYAFVIVTLTALKALYLVFTGFGPEAAPLITGLNQNGILRKGRDRIHTRFVIKRGRGVLNGMYDAAGTGICAPPRKGEQQCRYDQEKALFERWFPHKAPALAEYELSFKKLRVKIRHMTLPAITP